MLSGRGSHHGGKATLILRGSEAMASLYPFIADGARSGQRVELKLHKALWKSVGHGDILSLGSFEVDLAGYLSVIVYSGNLRIRLQLNDRDETTSMGPCALQINSHTDPDAVYRVEKNLLAVDADFDGRRTGIRLSRDRGGKLTRCELTGYIGLTTYLQTVS